MFLIKHAGYNKEAFETEVKVQNLPVCHSKHMEQIDKKFFNKHLFFNSVTNIQFFNKHSF